MDSLYYGRFEVTVTNFVYVNVVENISKHFGVAPVKVYLDQLKDNLTDIEAFMPFHLFFLVLFSVYQMNGQLPGNKNKIPSFLIFTITNLTVLSCVPHKESRFMAMIFPLFAVYWAFAFVLLEEYAKILNRLVNVKFFPTLVHLLGRIFFLVYIFQEL
jgi:hypothetical protein